MKANKLFFFTIASVLSVQALSPDAILKSHSSAGRMPANQAEVDAKGVEDKKNNETVTCKSEAKGEKLEADLKKLLSDKEEVLKRVEGLQKENDKLKLKLTSNSETKVEDKKPEETKVAEVKAEDKKSETKQSVSQDKKSDNSELVALMAQMTSMFTAQMQSQMQMQLQMMNMFSQMQSNAMPQMNPYAPSVYTGNYFNNNPYAYPTIGSTLGAYSAGVGIPAQSSPWSSSINPYTVLPAMTRQQISTPADFGFSFNQSPTLIRGFDFNQVPAATQQPIRIQPKQQIENQQIPFSGVILSA